MNKEKRLIESKLVSELYRIRIEIDKDKEKAKQMLSDLERNIKNRVGKCFAMRKMKELY